MNLFVKENDYDSYAVAVAGNQGDIKAIIFCDKFCISSLFLLHSRTVHCKVTGNVFDKQ
jgi:hypothetical protein